MAGDIVLGIRLTGDGSGLVGAVRLSSAELDKFEKEAGQAGRAARKAANDTGTLEQRQRMLGATSTRLGGIVRSLAGAAGFAGLSYSAIALGRGILSTASNFEQLRLRLETVSGSAAMAALQFEDIEQFAASTPFEVDRLVDAYTRLQAAGLSPSIDLMESFGNTAAAFGRDITEFADAVVGAVTGETERLKAFGIIARIEGDKMALNFRGHTVEVQRDAQAITAALAEIGRTDFAGGMARQTQSLAGAASNAADAVSALFDEIGRHGVTDAATESVNRFTRTVENLRRHAFPTLNEQVDDLQAEMSRLEQQMDESAEASRKGMTMPREVAAETLASARETLSELRNLQREDFRQRERIAMEAAAREAEIEEDRRREERKREAEAFSERRQDALGYLEDVERDRLESQGNTAELIALDRDRDLAELEQLHQDKLISEEEFLDAYFSIQAAAIDRTEKLEQEARGRREAEQQAHFSRLQSNTSVTAELLKEVWATGMKGQLAVASWGFGQLATLQQSHSKKLFAVGKAAAIAQTIVDTYAAAQAAYKSFAEIPPLAALMAALAVAQGFIRVEAIRSTEIGGSTSVSTAAGGGGAAPSSIGTAPTAAPVVTPPPAPTVGKPVFNFYFSSEGRYTSEEILEGIMPVMEELLGDGYGAAA